MTSLFQVRTQIASSDAPPLLASISWEIRREKKQKRTLTPSLTRLCLPQIDLEPEGKVYVVIDLSGSSTEGNHNTAQHNSAQH